MTGRLNDNSLDAWASRFIGKEKVSVNASAGRSQVLLYGFDSLAVDTGFTPVDAPTLAWSRAQVQANLKSHHKDSTAFNHSVNVSLGLLGNDPNAQERSLRVAAVGTQFFGRGKVNWIWTFSSTAMALTPLRL